MEAAARHPSHVVAMQRRDRNESFPTNHDTTTNLHRLLPPPVPCQTPINQPTTMAAHNLDLAMAIPLPATTATPAASNSSWEPAALESSTGQDASSLSSLPVPPSPAPPPTFHRPQQQQPSLSRALPNIDLAMAIPLPAATATQADSSIGQGAPSQPPPPPPTPPPSHAPQQQQWVLPNPPPITATLVSENVDIQAIPMVSPPQQARPLGIQDATPTCEAQVFHQHSSSLPQQEQILIPENENKKKPKGHACDPCLNCCEATTMLCAFPLVFCCLEICS